MFDAGKIKLQYLQIENDLWNNLVRIITPINLINYFVKL